MNDEDGLGPVGSQYWSVGPRSSRRWNRYISMIVVGCPVCGEKRGASAMLAPKWSSKGYGWAICHKCMKAETAEINASIARATKFKKTKLVPQSKLLMAKSREASK